MAKEVGDVMISVIYECPLQRVGEGKAGVQTDGLRQEKDGFLLLKNPPVCVFLLLHLATGS